MIYFLLKLVFSFCIFQPVNTTDFNSEIDECKRYNIESAHIKYNVSGNTKGNEELYFHQWGKQEMIKINVITEFTFYSVKNIQKENTINILNDKISIKIDLNNKTGVKTNLPNSEKSTFGNNISSKHFNLLNLTKNGGKKIGTGTVLNKNCDIWQIYKNKIWIWNGIALKIISKKTGINRITEAVEIKTDIKIDTSLFLIPNDIKIVDYTREK